jgi:hypothetical protein
MHTRPRPLDAVLRWIHMSATCHIEPVASGRECGVGLTNCQAQSFYSDGRMRTDVRYAFVVSSQFLVIVQCPTITIQPVRPPGIYFLIWRLAPAKRSPSQNPEPEAARKMSLLVSGCWRVAPALQQ